MTAKKSLSERLADLTSAAPSETFNPDAPDFDDGTGAGLSRYDDYGDEGDLGLSGDGPSADLRVAADMESIGQEYHGKKVSRKTLEATSGMVGDAPDPEASDGGGSSDEDGGGLEGAGGASMVTSLNLDDISSSEDDAFDDNDQDDDDDDDNHDDDGDIATDSDTVAMARREGGISAAAGRDEGGEEGGHGQLQANVFAGMRDEDVDATVEAQIMRLDRQDTKAKRGRGAGMAGEGELKRAREALRQRQWWDSLLEVRILLQRLLNAANKLPGPNELPLFLEGDDSLAALAEEGASAAQGLAGRLSAARRSQMTCWGITPTEATAALSSNSGQKNDGPNSKEGQREEEEEEKVAATEHGVCMKWWEGMLGRWHEKTQLVDPGLQKKFRVVNQGPWAQVRASLADRERANRRAFMTESETGEFLGRKLAKRLKSMSQEGTEADVASARARKEAEEGGDNNEVLRHERRKVEDRLDLEVLDDRDLYQHLLKEFMDASGAGGNGYGASAGVPLKRKSRKKVVDRRASKGRKIKYVTHPKMQNFMFSQEYEPAPMEPSELFASLLGGAGNNTQ